MSNLENFNNIYANLAESSYNSRPKNFPYESLTKKQKEILDANKSLQFDYSKDGVVKNDKGQITNLTKGGANLPNNGVVYLQPDKMLHIESVHTDLQVPKVNGGFQTESYVASNYQKGLLTDERAGFNAYFVTDTPKLNQETRETYFAVRGSDTMAVENLNDWVANDGNFALTNTYIPQAKLANQAIVSKIKVIKAQAPNAKLNVTGHSLGTIVSAQAVAALYHDRPKAFDTVGKVVLFDGPDVTQSLKKMGLSDQEIKIASEKVTYYVNPFDVVSMLNRTASYEKQFGHVNVVVPVHFSTTFDDMSSHDFGEFQMDTQGKPLVASKNFHPEMLNAGRQLAKLTEQTISKIAAVGISRISNAAILVALGQGIAALVALGMTAIEAKSVYDDFAKSYKDIITKANQRAKEWDAKHIPAYQNKIRSASGRQKIELRIELLQSVAQDAQIRSEEFTTEVKKDLSEALENIRKEVLMGIQAAHDIAQHLDAQEINFLLADFNIAHFWDAEIEESTNRAAKYFQTEIEEFSITLMKIAQNIEQVDAQGGAEFKALMNQQK